MRYVPAVVSALLALALSLPLPLHAQDRGDPPAPGDRVRVRWTPPPLRGGVLHIPGPGGDRRESEGTLRAIGSDTLHLDTEGGRLALPLASLASIRRGHVRTRWDGFKRGFTVGALIVGPIAAVAGAIEGAACEREGGLVCPGPAGGAALLGVGGALAGGVAGGLLKSASPGVEWREVELRPLVAPANGSGRTGATVGISIRF